MRVEGEGHACPARGLTECSPFPKRSTWQQCVVLSCRAAVQVEPAFDKGMPSPARVSLCCLAATSTPAYLMCCCKVLMLPCLQTPVSSLLWHIDQGDTPAALLLQVHCLAVLHLQQQHSLLLFPFFLHDHAVDYSYNHLGKHPCPVRRPKCVHLFLACCCVVSCSWAYICFSQGWGQRPCGSSHGCWTRSSCGLGGPTIPSRESSRISCHTLGRQQSQAVAQGSILCYRPAFHTTAISHQSNQSRNKLARLAIA